MPQSRDWRQRGPVEVMKWSHWPAKKDSSNFDGYGRLDSSRVGSKTRPRTQSNSDLEIERLWSIWEIVDEGSGVVVAWLDPRRAVLGSAVHEEWLTVWDVMTDVVEIDEKMVLSS